MAREESMKSIFRFIIRVVCIFYEGKKENDENR